MLKKKKKDPRLADLKSTTSNKAPDMVQATETASTQTSSRRARSKSESRPSAAAKKRVTTPPSERPAPNRPAPVAKKPRSSSAGRPEWTSTVLAILGIALLGYLLASGLSKISSTLQANQERQTISDVWRQLLIANVKIDGTPTNLDEQGNASFPSVSMEAVTDKLSMHRNLRLAAALPGVKSLNLSPMLKRNIGAGICDDSTLELAVKNFPVLDSLDLSATKVTSLTAINDMQVRELRLINTTIKHEKLPELSLFSSVTDVWIGWDFDGRNPENAVYRSEVYKKQLLSSLAKMKNLKNLYLYKIKFDAEERKKLPDINIETL